MIICRSAAEIERMRAANQFVADVLAELEAAVAPGVTTLDLDRLAEKLSREGGAIPAFKGYRGFPATLCASINEEVVHGIPSATRALKDGDIISLDMGVKLGGYYGDSAVTVPVGTKYYIMIDAGPMVGKMIADDVEPDSSAIDLGDVRL